MLGLFFDYVKILPFGMDESINKFPYFYNMDKICIFIYLFLEVIVSILYGFPHFELHHYLQCQLILQVQKLMAFDQQISKEQAVFIFFVSYGELIIVYLFSIIMLPLSIF